VSSSVAPPDLSGYIVEERFSVARVRRWMRLRRDLVGFIIDVLFTLMSEEATGKLTINLTRGHASCAEFEEIAKPSTNIS
jgi:hypothetical protein